MTFPRTAEHRELDRQTRENISRYLAEKPRRDRVEQAVAALRQYRKKNRLPAFRSRGGIPRELERAIKTETNL